MEFWKITEIKIRGSHVYCPTIESMHSPILSECKNIFLDLFLSRGFLIKEGFLLYSKCYFGQQCVLSKKNKNVFTNFAYVYLGERLYLLKKVFLRWENL